MTEKIYPMTEKIYRLYGINTAMHLLRPGAKWEISNRIITRWDDPRPIPSWEEIDATMEKIKAFEESINTIWLPKQLDEIAEKNKQLAEALGDS